MFASIAKPGKPSALVIAQRLKARNKIEKIVSHRDYPLFSAKFSKEGILFD